MLAGKKIVLGITGGIAAYKCAYLVRLLVKKGAEVQVVMTPNAKEFITPVTMSALSGKPVVSEFFTANTGEWHSHVSLGLWADAMVIAPATASTLGKMANGVADNMLITTYLSMKAPVLVCPAMDLDMWAHPSTFRNIKTLKSYGNIIVEPTEGELASHLTGKGRMAEPERIVEAIDAMFASEKTLAGKKVLITSGPTYELIDPVRYIGNFSSGKMGFALAEECARRGAEVCLITGPTALTTENSLIHRIDVMSAKDMCKAAEENFESCHLAILAAAVADYAPSEYSDKKIKREKKDELTIHLVKNPDIAATLGNKKRKDQILVGFALETDDGVDNAKGKLARKNLDWIVLNSLKDKEAGFQKDTNKVTLISANGELKQFPAKLKSEVAVDIINTVI
jgi:phosphopantothenoylcysteine decarboxylase/phosphopantothenate--cysteine ligase